jgi:hypothetical protein
MRPWIIVFSSAIGGIAVAAVLIIRELRELPPSDFASLLVAQLPAFAIAALAVYALCSMSMVTAASLTGILRIRRNVEAIGPDADRSDWLAASGADGFRQLALKLGLDHSSAESSELRSLLRIFVLPSEIRREFARLHYILLARTHFFSALIVLAGIIGLGLAQDRGSVPFPWGTIPTMSGTLVLVGLVLLTVLGRIALDVTAEPLLERVPLFPAERVELGLLRRTVDVLERSSGVSSVSDERAAATPIQLPEGLLVYLEEGRHAVLEAVGHLSENMQALLAAVQSSAETILAAAAQQPMLDAERPASGEVTSAELKAAVEELTSTLKSLSAAPRIVEDAAPPPGPVPPQRTPASPRLARELRGLLQEIDARR